MEEESSVKVLSVSDLLHHVRRPLTAASSLSSGRPIPRPPPANNHSGPSDRQNPISYKTLRPLNYPTLLVGTLTLTLPSVSCSNSSCLKFSDHSAAVCCDILDLDLKVIGKTIRVLAWNFFPTKLHGGFLEIIRWSVDQSESISLSNLHAFRLNSVFPAAYEESSITRYMVYGLLESVSPVTNVPCTVDKNVTKNLGGFLARIFVCECKLCCSKNRVMALQDIIGDQDKHHRFTKPEIVYFCASASIWYPAILRLIGCVVLISGLRKKVVFLGKEESLMMHVTTEKAVLHLPSCPSKIAMGGRNTNIREKDKCGVYTGSITGVYIQGMVIELDQKVLLLLTDHQLSMPHSLRVGAIVTVRNFHRADPKFPWTKVQLFGSCFKTIIHVNVFSPLESGCYQLLQSQSLLRKFIESLAFSARLWVLLVVSSLRKKFGGVLSETEILGSKHKEGLVQKYCSSCLPLSIFRFRLSVFTEYCQHELCGCGKEIDYNPPKLVVPISNFVSYCEDAFMKMLNASGTDSDTNHHDRRLICGGKSHDQPIRNFLTSEDMNVVLLGTLKISQYSGKLQLTDATGSVDIVIPGLPSVWRIEEIYEINDFSVVMEGIPQQLEHLESLTNEPFSCRNIFNHFQLVRKRKFAIYIYCHLRDAKSRNRILCPSTDREEISKELESGKFHLLWLAHKFPVQQKFPGGDVVSQSSSIYAEAIFLPWNLLHLKEDRDSIESHTRENPQENAAFPHEFPCTIDCRIVNSKTTANLGALLNCTGVNALGDCFCKGVARKFLLEFRPDGFMKYESLRIGGYYLLKHHNNDLVCTANDPYNTSYGKVVVNSKSHLWSVLFDDKEAKPKTSRQVEIPILRSIDECPETCPDVRLHLSSDHLSFLEAKLKALKEDLIQPTISIKESLNISRSPQRMMSASAQFGAFGVNLPAGNLLSVQGLVVGVHNFDHNRPSTRSSDQIFKGAYQIIPGATSSICIHVKVDNNIVKIYSGLSKHSYPVGFGPGVKANFHRVLLTAGDNMLKLTPASFIEIDSIVIGNESEDTSVQSVFENTASLATGPATLISETMQFSERKQIQLNCKIVAIYVLVLEKNNELLQSFPRTHSEIPFKIPLAGFIMDDGSSSCCCWTDNERAATLLHLHERRPHRKRPRRSLRKPSNAHNVEIPCRHAMSRLSKIVDRHGTVVISNCGSLSDPSCQNITLSVDSGSAGESDGEFLKSVVLEACFGNSWNIVGTMMEPNAARQLEERLQRLGMAMLPSQNIWASEVSHLDTLTQGRNILQELMESI